MLELGIPTLDALFADLPELFQNTAEAWGHEENGMFMNTTVRAQSSVFFFWDLHSRGVRAPEH